MIGAQSTHGHGWGPPGQCAWLCRWLAAAPRARARMSHTIRPGGPWARGVVAGLDRAGSAGSPQSPGAPPDAWSSACARPPAPRCSRWSCGGSAFQRLFSLALDHVGHQAGAALRYAVAAILMLAFLRFGMRSAESVAPLSRRAWGWFALAGLIGVALYNGLFFLGLSMAPAIDGSSIMPVMSPVFTAALASVVARERPGPLRSARGAGHGRRARPSFVGAVIAAHPTAGRRRDLPARRSAGRSTR